MTSPRWTAATCERSLPAETTAPALCGPLVAAPQKQSAPTKTGHVAGATKIYTASLHVEADPPPWLCVLGDPAGDRRRGVSRLTVLVITAVVVAAAVLVVALPRSPHRDVKRHRAAATERPALRVARTRLGPILVDGRGPHVVPLPQGRSPKEHVLRRLRTRLATGPGIGSATCGPRRAGGQAHHDDAQGPPPPARLQRPPPVRDERRHPSGRHRG